MKKYSWIKKVGKSLVPSDFYIHVLQEPIHKAFVYMLLFITLLSLVTGAYQGYKLMSVINDVVADYDRGYIQPFKISTDGVWVEGDAPVILDLDIITIILDDENTLDINDVMTYDQAILFGSEHITSKTPIGTSVTAYKELGSNIQMMMAQSFDSESQIRVYGAVSFMFIPAFIITHFLMSIVSFFYYGLMVLMIANVTRTVLGLGLRLKQVYHMVIYSMTFSVFWTHFTYMLPTPPPTVLDTIVHLVLPSIILFNIFLHIRRRAIDEIQKRKK